MSYALIETAIGTFGIAWTDAGIARVALPGRDRARTELWISRDPAEPGFPDGVLLDLPDRIKRYAEGAREDFTDVPLDLAGIPDFNRQAYAELLKIAEIVVGMIVIGTIGFLLNEALLLVEKRLFRWRWQVTL